MSDQCGGPVIGFWDAPTSEGVGQGWVYLGLVVLSVLILRPWTFRGKRP